LFPQAEVLEGRSLLSVTLEAYYGISSFAGVGFSLNPVIEIGGTSNGQPDDAASDYRAQIDWGDRTTWDTNTALVSGGINGHVGLVLVKGSHLYQQEGTYDITVDVTGPGGQTLSDDSATATVYPMPEAASQPITVPSAYPGAQALAYESMGVSAYNGISSFAGVGFSLNPVIEISGIYSGQPDDTASDYRAQIDWGDRTTWDTNTALVSGGINGHVGLVLVKGSHLYQQEGTYDITVDVTGPGGQTLSDDSATATVYPMPDAASQPITVPIAYPGAQPLAYESLGVAAYQGISSFAGVGFSLNPVIEISGIYDGQPDDTASDYRAQINWGDSPAWDTNTALVTEGVNSHVGLVLVEGLHVFKQAGTYDITVYVTGPDGQTFSDDSASATITPNPNAINVGNLSPTQWQENQPNYDGTIPLSGGSGAYRNLQIGNLPAGLSADVLTESLNGKQIGAIDITGTPTESGTFNLQVSIEDASGDSGGGTETLTINSAVTLGNLVPAEWTVDEPGYTGSIDVNGGGGGYQSLVVTGLPPGLSFALESTSVVIDGQTQQSGRITISGTPTQSGLFTFYVSLQDGNGEWATHQLGGLADFRGFTGPAQQSEPGNNSNPYSIKIDAASSDLAVAIDSALIAAASPASPILPSIAGNEELIVPVTITNLGPSAADGPVTLNFSLVAPGEASLALNSFTVKIDLATGASTSPAALPPREIKLKPDVSAVLAAGLTVGGAYQIRVQLSSTTISDPNSTNNTDTTAGAYNVVLLNPPNFTYHLSFGKDYTIRSTPKNYRSGRTAMTGTYMTYAGPDTNGNFTISFSSSKASSWVYDWVFDPAKFHRTATAVTQLLEHEQGHYDISALVAREFLSEAQGLSASQALALWNNIRARNHSLQVFRYDTTTKHGVDPITQARWSAEIASLKGSQTGTFTALEQWARTL
jgi:hypothetical protein